MAKLKGPLYSEEARGKFGSNVVFNQRKGQAVARRLVIPANPKSAGQTTARNIVRITGALQKWVNATALKAPTQTLLDKARIAAITPASQTWNSYLTGTIAGVGQVNYDAAVAAYSALTAPQKTAWGDAAAALTPVILDVGQTVAGGGAGTAIDAGEVFFIYIYALSLLGLSTTPTGTPPTYA